MPRGVWKNGLKPKPPSRKGSTLSERHKESLRKAIIGNTWNRGRKHTNESTRLKSVNSARYWKGKVRGPQSKETIEKRSRSLKGHMVSDTVRDRMKTLLKGKFGKEHPRWTEDKKRPLYKAIRQLYKYKEWRMAIFTRDNFSCVICQAVGYMEVDHFPVRFVDILKRNEITSIELALTCVELWDAENGRTLCKPCHLKTLTWGRKSVIEEL